MHLSRPPPGAKEQMLLDLSQWIARALQYSPGHASCAPLAVKTHRSLGLALSLESPLEFGVLKDDLLMGEEKSTNLAIRTRLAPYLHERGALLLRFAYGVSQEELVAFVEILARPVQSIFDAGGLLRLVVDGRISHIQIEEIAHDITAEEREEHRRRKRLRAFFSEMLREMLARRAIGFPIGDQLGELLDHPDVAVAILEDDVRGTAEAVACLALMVQEEEVRSGKQLAASLRQVLWMLSPRAREHVVVGFPRLVGEFRRAMAWVFDGFTEDELAHFAFPAVRGHPTELHVPLYALSVLVLHDGSRLSALRRVALGLHDLPVDEPATAVVLDALAQEAPTYDSFRRERECLQVGARAVLDARLSLLREPEARSLPPAPSEGVTSTFDGTSSVVELMKISGRMKDFDRFAATLPGFVARLAEDGSVDAVVGVLRGLSEVTSSWHDLAQSTLSLVASPSTAALLLDRLGQAVPHLEGSRLEDAAVVVKLLAVHAPAAVFDSLEKAESRKMRRVLLDALPLAGPKLLPILRSRLRTATWFVARNIVLLIPRVGGSAVDLEPTVRHPNEQVRIEIVRALRALPSDVAAMDIVVSYLTDKSAEVTKRARGMLRGETLGPNAIVGLRNLAQDNTQPEELRRLAIQTLGRCASDAAAAVLLELLQPQGLLEMGSLSALRDLAAVALHGSPAPAAGGYFAQGLESSVWRVRRACERAAGSA